MRLLLASWLLLLSASACLASFQGQAKAPRQSLPTDARQRHVERLTAGRQAYTVHFRRQYRRGDDADADQLRRLPPGLAA